MLVNCTFHACRWIVGFSTWLVLVFENFRLIFDLPIEDHRRILFFERGEGGTKRESARDKQQSYKKNTEKAKDGKKKERGRNHEIIE